MRAELAGVTSRAVLVLGLMVSSSVAVNAATISFTTSAGSDRDAVGSNIDFVNLHIGVPPSPNTFLPGFDPSIGTLLSARIDITGGLLTTLLTHSGAPAVAVFTRASATGHAVLSSATNLFLPLSLNTDHPTIMAGDTGGLFDPPFAEVSSTAFDSLTFAQTYTGASLSSFLGFPLPFVVSQPHADTLFHVSGAPGSFFVLPPDFDGHPVWFGDAHFDTSVDWVLSVTYTYEPLAATPVPEPASLLLLGGGLAGLAFRGRPILSRRRGSTSQCRVREPDRHVAGPRMALSNDTRRE